MGVSGLAAGLAQRHAPREVIKESIEDSGRHVVHELESYLNTLGTIAAVVIGGTSIKGGQGAVWRTVLGVLLLALINNAFNILNLQPQWRDILTAAIIVSAVAVNTIAARR